MDTLISIGVGAAFLWSLYALFFGDAGMAGMKMSFSCWDIGQLLPEHLSGGGVRGHLFSSCSGGTWRRGRRPSQARHFAPASMGAKDAAVLRDGSEVRVAVGDLVVGDRFVVRPGEKIATDGRVVEVPRPSTRAC